MFYSTVLALLGVFVGSSAWGANTKILPGHVPSEVARLTPKGRVATTNQIRLAIGVPLHDPTGFEAFLTALYDPASPDYRQYITPEEFAQRFGPTEAEYAAVKRFAQTNGLAIIGTHSNRLVLDVAGPTAAVEKAFHISLLTYQHPTENRIAFAPNAEPTVDATLPVADVQGLSDFHRPRPKFQKMDTTHVVPRNGSAPDGSGAYFGNDFRNAYAAGATLTGAGQSVGLLQFDGFYASDIAGYARAAGNGRTNIVIQTILLDGFNGVPTTGPNSGSGEVSLDIEMAMAMAPGLSRIVVFEAGPNGFQNDVLNSMAANSSVKSLSSSWGWNGGPSTTTDNIFKLLAAQGQSFFNASGDSGAFTVGASSVNGVDNTSTANAPSSSPYITQVGGTTLSMSGSGSSFASESVWNWGGGSASSGGVSSYYAIPSWQANISMAANLGSTTQRNVPDVAMVADNVFVYYNNGSRGAFGGTSCAAPLWAGYMALVNQQAANTGNAPPGLINAAVYAIGAGQNSSYSYSACFHDTTAGNNYWSSSPNLYPAVSGYDLCTGWGSPNGLSLISALAGSVAATGAVTQASLKISPPTGFAVTGPFGGPFAPTTSTFQLTNTTTAALNWKLLGLPVWLKASATNGTLAASWQTNVALSVNTGASKLKPGSYSTSLTFSNLTAHVAQNVPFSLLVYQPISLSPTNGFAAVGGVGGPYSPNAQTFVLSNLTASSLKWGLVRTSTWLSVSVTNGTLAAGAHGSVTIAVASAANTLPAAVYRSTVVFTNTAGVIAAVPFTLSIGQPLLVNGGFETGNFSGWTQSGNTAYTTVASYNSAYVHSGSRGVQAGPSATPGYLSQTVATTPGQAYLLSLWLRNASGQTPNWFQVQWNGATVAELANLATTGWTNLQFIVTATGSSSSLQLGFQDDPYYLGIDDVSLRAVSTPTAHSAAKNSNGFQFGWNALAGAVYQAQYRTNLFQGDWINLGNAFTANAATMTITDTNATENSPQRFYRMVMVSPQP
ncbi:MAG TPA: protease pro-enzyme activation domain-containing protein [Verrucomicrobiae bacterium]